MSSTTQFWTSENFLLHQGEKLERMQLSNEPSGSRTLTTIIVSTVPTLVWT